MKLTTLVVTVLAVLIVSTSVSAACTQGEWQFAPNVASDGGVDTYGESCTERANEALWSHGREVIIGSGGQSIPSGEGFTAYLEVLNDCDNGVSSLNDTSAVSVPSYPT